MTNNKKIKRKTVVSAKGNKLEFSTAFPKELDFESGEGTCRIENALLYQILKMKHNISSLRFIEMMVYEPTLDEYIPHFACMYKQKGDRYTESRANGQHYKMLWARWNMLKKMNVLREIKPVLMKCDGINTLVDNTPYYKILRGVWEGVNDPNLPNGYVEGGEEVLKIII